MSLGINNERAETRKCRIYCKSVDRKESVQWVSYKYRFFFFCFFTREREEINSSNSVVTTCTTRSALCMFLCTH